ncbi:MAG: carboxypeptidase-like regulatory domain-containing protein [Chloroflexi bacterium]|nr:carboxypeptidase-like regulatory domain-containing protein [Chloroflexota bacterium]
MSLRKMPWLLAILLLALAACTAAGGESGAAPAADSGGGEVEQSGGIQFEASEPTAAFEYSGPAPAAGAGNVVGRLLWNGQPVIDLPVKLCDEIEFFGGCQGQEYDTTTDSSGVFVFADIPPMTYGLTFHSLESDDWMYFTSGILDARDFEVTAGDVLNVGDQNIVKFDVQLVQPAEESQVSQARPVLEWQAYPEADYYEITLSSQRGYSIFLFDELQETSIASTEDLLNCNYGWYVKAYNDQGIQIAETEGIWHFDEVNQPYSCYVTGLSPADGATASAGNLTLTWDLHELAAYYKINMYGADDSSINPLDFVQADTNSYTVTQTIEPGTYSWVVYAYNEAGDFFAFSDTYTLVIQ